MAENDMRPCLGTDGTLAVQDKFDWSLFHTFRLFHCCDDWGIEFGTGRA